MDIKLRQRNRKQAVFFLYSLATIAMFLVALCSSQTVAEEVRSNAEEIFRSRIAPIANSRDKSSCTECHFSGVDLKDFIGDTPEETWNQLRNRGWIDVEHPAKSKILEFIQRGQGSKNELIERVRSSEYAAMKEWIEAAVRDPEWIRRPAQVDRDIELPVERIRHTRRDQVLDRFCDAIWSQLQRCANCHSPERNAKQVKEHGEQMSWIVPRDPDATLRLLVERGLIDLKEPFNSEIRTKPVGIVEHGGGPKFVLDGHVDRNWTSFLSDFSASVDGVYFQPAQKPVPKRSAFRSWLSELQLRITDLPTDWGGKVVTVKLFPKEENGEWSSSPVAIADSSVNDKQAVWQQAFTIYSSVNANNENRIRWSEPITIEQALPKGEYLLTVVRANDDNADSSQTMRAKLTAPWPPGYQPPKILKYNELRSGTVFLK